MVLAVLMFAALLAGGIAAEGSYGIIYLTPSAASACWSQVEVGILQAKADLEKELGITINYSVVGPAEEQETEKYITPLKTPSPNSLMPS